MTLRIGNTIFTGEDAQKSIELSQLTDFTGSCDLYVDIGRTDSYTPDGTFNRPYKTIKEAVDIANLSASSTTPYAIHVAPGTYTEDPIEIAPFVKVSGSGWNSTIVVSNNLNDHLFTMCGGSVLRDVLLLGPTLAGKACIYHCVSDTYAIGIIEVIISRGYYGIYDAPATTGGQVLTNNVGFQYSGYNITEFFRAEDHGDIYAVGSILNAGTNQIAKGFVATGANAIITVVESFHKCANSVGIFVDDSAMVRIISSIFSNGTTAIHVGSNGSPRVRAESTLIHRIVGGGYTNDIKIESATSSVHFVGTASKDRIVNLVGGTIYAVFQNLETGEEGGCILGEVNIGETYEKTLPLVKYNQSSSLSGLVSGGEVTRNVSPSRILNVASGYGFVNDGTDPIYVVWSGTTVEITASSTEYVYVTKSGAVTTNSVQPDYATNIVLAQAVSNANDIVILTRDEINISHSLSRIQEFFEDVIGPLSVSGGIVTASATPLKLDVSLGKFTIGISERDIAGGSDVPFYYVSNDGVGGWTYTASTLIDTANIDAGSGPVPYPGADHWKKDAWYVVVNDGGETYYCVYGQAAYADQAAAENGALPTAPDILDHYGMRAAGIVSHKDDAAITSILDIRPMLGQNAPITGAVAADHDLLLNLNHDTHLQYLTSGRADTWLLTKTGNTVNLVDNGNDHNHLGGDGAQIDHTTLSNIGTRTHLQLESDINTHISDIANPHAVTKTQVSLGNVTNDAQLKRSANDFSSFSQKTTPTTSDIVLIEDAADTGNKKYITLGSLPDPIFGSDYQISEVSARTTYNTTTAFQNKVTLTTPALTGTYRISWSAVIDGSATYQNVEAQLYNSTDAAIVGVVRVFRPANSAERYNVNGFTTITFTGAAKTFYLQYRTNNTGSTVGIADAKIEIFRIS